ncbi:class I SAM-dependent methyltransferase [Nitrospira sp. Nam80]
MPISSTPQGNITLFSPKLLPRAARIKTSSVEPPTFNVLGLIQRLRFWLLVSLLPRQRLSRLLEVGYGSGILLPELAQHCDELYGIDIHPNAAQVLHNLRHYQVDAKLLCGSAFTLPFDDQTFDCIVAVSCLEYMDPLDGVAREIKRVLRADGCFIFVTPGDSPLIDLGVKLLTGRSPRKHYGDRRASLIPTLLQSFVVQKELVTPRIGGRLSTFYRGMRLGVS